MNEIERLVERGRIESYRPVDEEQIYWVSKQLIALANTPRVDYIIEIEDANGEYTENESDGSL